VLNSTGNFSFPEKVAHMLNTVCHDAELQMPMLNAEFIFNEGLCYKKGCSSYRPYFADLYS